MIQRRPMIAANWKMNGSRELVAQTSQQLAGLAATTTEILICPPVIFLANFPKSDRYLLGAQNISNESKGAFTGEISADMLIEAGASYVIVGHSERRALYGDTDQMVLAKTLKAVSVKLTPIVCFGETLIEKQQEKTFQVIAYEPVWAIGTGETATPEQAQQVHLFIRDHLSQFDAVKAQQIRIIYGGSVNAENCKALFSQPDIDGGLVGGASLKPAEFAAICLSAQE